jgi:hypothetical protein
MSVSIKAYYENGEVKLTEQAPTEKNVPVTVIFPEPERLLKKNEIRFGSLTGKISVPKNFDDEIEDLKEYI